MRITEELIESLSDQLETGTFEKITKGLSSTRQDSKRLTDKADRKREKDKRKNRKEGNWSNLEMIMGGV